LRSGGVNVPDLKKLFVMFTALLRQPSKPVVIKALLLVAHLAATLLQTEVEMLWRAVGGEVVRLAGAEEEETRRRARETLFAVLALGKNALMVLETLFYAGRGGGR
jgi:hypothetical protein